MNIETPNMAPADRAENREGIPKSHLKALIKSYGLSPGVNCATFIAAGALGRKTTWTGTDYAEHWLRVSGIALGDFVTNDEIIVGILHDVLEDSDWTIEDLEEIGFSPLVCEAVRSVTKMEGELYLDATKRASINPLGCKVKMRDNKDNMDLTRSTRVATDKQKYLYHISYTYLKAVENGEIPPNYCIWKFLRIPKYAKLLTKDNVFIIEKRVSEKMPADIRARFSS